MIVHTCIWTYHNIGVLILWCQDKSRQFIKLNYYCKPKGNEHYPSGERHLTENPSKQIILILLRNWVELYSIALCPSNKGPGKENHKIIGRFWELIELWLLVKLKLEQKSTQQLLYHIHHLYDFLLISVSTVLPQAEL